MHKSGDRASRAVLPKVEAEPLLLSSQCTGDDLLSPGHRARLLQLLHSVRPDQRANQSRRTLLLLQVRAEYIPSCSRHGDVQGLRQDRRLAQRQR